MTLATSDANISNTTFTLLFAMKGTKDSVADDTNTSSAIVASFPFDMNLSNGTIGSAGLNQSSIVKYQVKAPNGSATVTRTDVNASTLGLAATTIDLSTTNILKD
ncbi:MAG: hypothetical protein Q9M43_00210 [Sulfurimonas sp.]|nr:hypothetical protein [Sulfurimonas sp.]